MFKGLFQKIVGDPAEKTLAQIKPRVAKINELAESYEQLTEAQLRAKTDEFKSRLAKGQTLEDILPEAFAAVRAASTRTIGLRHFDVQLIGGIVLHQGKIAEMKTGEGKTLVATLPLYLNSLTGRGAHLVTPNDYLSKFGVQWMGPIYHALGVSVGVIQHESAFLFDPNYSHQDARYHHLRPVHHRREAYYADITYGTNNEFGFDYLRDNMVWDINECAQRELHYAIVDEVDNILIDEARTPLIISGQADEPTDLYRKFSDIASRLRRDDDYEVDEKHRNVTLTEEGIERVEKMLGITNLYSPDYLEWTPYLDQALKAHVIFQLDRDYIVKDGQVIIVDEFTGRLMHGRRFSEGLHQAIEAKEKVQIQRESLTLATITFQNYFRMYKKLAGMTGTAKTEEEEFQKIYNLDVTPIPTHRAMVRDDYTDQVYKTETAKYRAVVSEIEEMHKLGRPVLVGTTSVEKSEMLAELLKRRGLREYHVLNAKLHEKEAIVVAQAGRPGAITIATNMAGRGVDILLGGNPEGIARELLAKQQLDITTATAEQWQTALDQAKAQTEEDKRNVVALGGLHIVGTERHEARRIDNQLRGRAGRQGDPGSSRFYLSLEDDLMRRFGGEQVKRVMEWTGLEDDIPIEHNMIGKVIEQSQVKVEGYNFDIRKHVLQYDDVVNKQREVIYAERRKVLSKESLREDILEMVEGALTAAVEPHFDSKNDDELNLSALVADVQKILPLPPNHDIARWQKLDGDEVLDEVCELAKKYYAESTERMGKLVLTQLQRDGMTFELVATNPHPLFRAIIQVAQQSEDYTDMATTRLSELDQNTITEIITEGVALGRDRFAVLQVIDRLWIRHLTVLDDIREGIGLRAFGQQDPLVAFRKEASESFSRLLAQIEDQVSHTVFHLQFNIAAPQAAHAARELKTNRAQAAASKKAVSHNGQSKLGRNDPCWCGSGKKYKHCHMRKDSSRTPATAKRQ